MEAASLDWYSVQKDAEAKLREKPADDVKKKIIIPEPVPVGNHLAHFIRSIHWNSKGMLPSTAGSQRSYDKYNTVTRLSFQGPEDLKKLPGDFSCSFPRKREKIEDIILSPRHQLFNRWKVPDRLMTLVSVPKVLDPGFKPNTPAEVQPEREDVRTPSIHATPVSVKHISPPPSRIAREMSLPNIKLTTKSARDESRNGLQQTSVKTLKDDGLKQRALIARALERSKTMCADTRMKTPEFDLHKLPFALRPEAVPHAEEWLKSASTHDKTVIERVLKMTSKKHELENSLKKTLLPDAKETVEHWLADANEDERHVALNFFNSLASSKLMGMTTESKRTRLQEVINTLDGANPGAVSKNYLKRIDRRRKETTISDGKLRYIRLLTPNTRENRWMHATWHHLPEYRNDDIVDNWSSHYVRPQEPISRHFAIHPDWG